MRIILGSFKLKLHHYQHALLVVTRDPRCRSLETPLLQVCLGMSRLTIVSQTTIPYRVPIGNITLTLTISFLCPPNTAPAPARPSFIVDNTGTVKTVFRRTSAQGRLFISSLNFQPQSNQGLPHYFERTVLLYARAVIPVARSGRLLLINIRWSPGHLFVPCVPLFPIIGSAQEYNALFCSKIGQLIQHHKLWAVCSAGRRSGDSASKGAINENASG